jgi:hypothetical protein
VIEKEEGGLRRRNNKYWRKSHKRFMRREN